MELATPQMLIRTDGGRLVPWQSDNEFLAACGIAPMEERLGKLDDSEFEALKLKLFGGNNEGLPS